MATKRPPGNPNIAEVGKATRFKPGQVANPRGRRPSRKIAEAILAELDKPSAPGSPVTKREVFVSKLVDMASVGDWVAAKLLLAYAYGLPTQPLTVDLSEEARKLAAERGVDEARVISIYEQLRKRRAG